MTGVNVNQMNTASNSVSNLHMNSMDEVDVVALLHELWSRKWLIIAITFVCLMLGVVYASLQKPQYTADVLLQVEQNHSNVPDGDPMSFLGMGGRNKASAVETALLRSRFILAPLVSSLGLNVSATPKLSWWQHFSKKAKKATVTVNSFTLPKRALSKTFWLTYDKENHISLYNKKNKLILQGPLNQRLVSADHRYQLQISNVNAPIGTTFRLSKTPVSTVVKALMPRLKIEALGDKNVDTGLLSVSMNGPDAAQVVDILNTAARLAKEKNSEKKALEASNTLAFLEKQLPVLNDSLTAAEMKLNQYRASSGKINIKLQAKMLLDQLLEFDKKIAELKLEQLQMASQFTKNHPMAIELSKKLKELASERQALETEIKRLPDEDQVALRLIREVKVKSKLYTNLLNKIQGFEMIKAGLISDVQILTPAKMPHKPLPKKTALIYASSILLGLILSVFSIFLRKLFFPRIQDPQWIERHYNLANQAVLMFSKETKGSTLLAHEQPKSLTIEALRSLRTSIQIKLSCSPNSNVICILGLTPNVGKSFTSSNLAYLLASTGKRVLLIDADLRKGTTHQYFNLPASPGFAELLQGTAQEQIALRQTEHANLTVLPRGEHPADPSELLSSPKRSQLIQALAAKYDYVLIDTPPVLLVTDGVLVSTEGAINYLIVGANMHHQDEVEIGLKRIKEVGATLTGYIFNYSTPSSQTQGSSYAYYNSYSYYQNEDKPAPNRFKQRLTKVLQKT